MGRYGGRETEFNGQGNLRFDQIYLKKKKARIDNFTHAIANAIAINKIIQNPDSFKLEDAGSIKIDSAFFVYITKCFWKIEPWKCFFSVKIIFAPVKCQDSINTGIMDVPINVAGIFFDHPHWVTGDKL